MNGGCIDVLILVELIFPGARDFGKSVNAVNIRGARSINRKWTLSANAKKKILGYES